MLTSLREQIDSIDDQILMLLNERSRLSVEVGKQKGLDKIDIVNPQREEKILERLMEKNTGPLPKDGLCEIWRAIFASSRSLQHKL